tara:strand:+ start:177 stop:935 length:759 start_codon:yes stop_codon:yes gene_type:complete
MFCLDQETTQKIYQNVCKHFIETVTLQLHKEVDEEVASLVVRIMNSTITREEKNEEKNEEKKEEKEEEVKNKTCKKGMKKPETQRRFKFEKQHFKGKNDTFLRIGIEKESRQVRRIKPDNWTEDAIEVFYKKFPKLIDVLLERKSSSKKDDKNEKKTDLISSLVQKSKKYNTCEKDNIPKRPLFQNISKNPKKKKKVSRKKKKNVSQKINITEFQHEELKETAYIDEDDNIWNDKHEKMGKFDRDENSIIFV